MSREPYKIVFVDEIDASYVGKNIRTLAEFVSYDHRAKRALMNWNKKYIVVVDMEFVNFNMEIGHLYFVVGEIKVSADSGEGNPIPFVKARYIIGVNGMDVTLFRRVEEEKRLLFSQI